MRKFAIALLAGSSILLAGACSAGPVELMSCGELSAITPEGAFPSEELPYYDAVVGPSTDTILTGAGPLTAWRVIQHQDAVFSEVYKSGTILVGRQDRGVPVYEASEQQTAEGPVWRSPYRYDRFINDGLGIELLSAAPCEATDMFEVRMLVSSNGAYRHAAWDVGLLDLSGDTMRFAPYPLGRHLNVEPANVFRVVDTSPWTIERWTRTDEGLDTVVNRFVYENELGMFLDAQAQRSIRKQWKTLVGANAPEGEFRDGINHIRDRVPEAVGEQIGDWAFSPDWADSRRISLVGGRYWVLEVPYYAWGTRPYYTGMARIVTDATDFTNWLVLEQENSAEDRRSPVPIAMTVLGEVESIDLGYLEELLDMSLTRM